MKLKEKNVEQISQAKTYRVIEAKQVEVRDTFRGAELEVVH